MWWFKKQASQSTTNDVQIVSAAVAQSFVHVRRDVQNLHDWMRHIHNQHEAVKRDLQEHRIVVESQREEISRLHRIVGEIPKTKHEVKALLDEYYRIEAIMDRISKVEAGLEKVHSKVNQEVQMSSMALAPQQHLQPQSHASDEVLRKIAEIQERSQAMMAQKLQEISTRLDEKRPTPQSALKEKIMSRVARNSKEYVKSMIRQLIDKYGRASGLQLREIIVEEQGLSSKSSFYRLLAEIEQDNEVGVVREGKEKVYLSKAAKKSEDWVPDGR